MKEKLFLDTNAFLYFLRLEEGKWRKVANILENDEFVLFTSVTVLNELKYRLLWLRTAEFLKTDHKYKIIKEIKKNKDMRDEIYNKYLKFYFNMVGRVKVLDSCSHHEVLSCQLGSIYGLLPSDSSIIAIMMDNNVKKIVTSDSDFDIVKDIEVVKI